VGYRRRPGVGLLIVSVLTSWALRTLSSAFVVRNLDDRAAEAVTNVHRIFAASRRRAQPSDGWRQDRLISRNPGSPVPLRRPLSPLSHRRAIDHSA
jgi:hypothetical protein